jgi:hypothetical protein
MIDFHTQLKTLKQIASIGWAILLSTMKLPPFAERIDVHAHIFPDFYRKAIQESNHGKQSSLDGFPIELMPVRPSPSAILSRSPKRKAGK